MKTTVKIKNSEIKKLLDIEAYQFPKYSTAIINLANQNAQGTRPKVVGQMSELIKQFPGTKIGEWEEWYLEKHPEAIQKATEKISEMMKNLKDVMSKIDRAMIEKWVKDLVVIKTFIGLKFQEAIIRKGAELMRQKYRLAKPAEEAKNIDGYIGNIPVSIKPMSYVSKKALQEKIEVRIIYYEKKKDGLLIDYKELFEW